MPVHKGGKRGRNAGQGARKILHSRWKTFASLIINSQAKKHARMDRRNEAMQRRRKKRVCRFCSVSGFRTWRALDRHQTFNCQTAKEDACARLSRSQSNGSTADPASAGG